MRGIPTLAAAALVVLAASAPAFAAAMWNPPAYVDENTVELGVVRPDGSEKRFKVWIVVIDGQAYVRLGSRAAANVEQNKVAPYLKAKIAGQEFDRIKGVSVPEMAERVAAAMREKYWSDTLIRYAAHPLTLRLVAE